jgi:uncharacterized protein
MNGVPPGREEPIALIVAKAPVPGRVKTRLALAVGAPQAAALAQAMLLDTLDGCRREIGNVGILCTCGDELAILAELAGSGTPIVVQEGDGLGDALRTGVRHSLGFGGCALLVSSDIPGVPAGALREAVCLLEEGVDVVLGPGYDGGYWLIGVRELHPGLFEMIPWSTAGVLDATLARCRDLSLNARLLDRWRDIDTRDDVAALVDQIETLPGRRTAEALALLNIPALAAHAEPNREHVSTIEEVGAL